MTPAAVIRERQSRIEGRVLQINVSTAVERVGSALRREVVQAPRDDAELWSEIRSLQRKFFDGFHRRLRLIRNARIERTAGFLPFEQNAETAVGAVYGDVVPAVDRRSRRHLRKGKGIPNRARAD